MDHSHDEELEKSLTRSDVSWQGKETIESSTRPGDRVVRVARYKGFKRIAPGRYEVRSEAYEPHGGLAAWWGRVKRLIIGEPLSTAQASHERLTKTKALAVLSSDALSSVAYATEESMRVLLLAGVAALWYVLPIGAAITTLLFIVGWSYRQTIRAYPKGGGSYIVAKDNLGTMAGLTAGSSLMVSYILTVSVSVAAGVLALSSAFPVLHEWRVGLGVGAIVAITLINLRGIRESATIFMVPTYAFLVCMAALLGYGFYQAFFGDLKVTHSNLHTPEIVTGVSLFLILRAFASGGAALTGTEAIADGVPAFQPPEWINAQKTLMTMVVILAVMFGGITYLAWHAGAIPLEEGGETVVSQVARATFGTGPLYFTIQGATMMVLFLAANTAYSDYPRLSYFLARDHFLPHQFTYRGDRLAYSWGIVALGVLSAFVLWVFRGEISLLIPLYAFGVFSAFTLSQSGMVMRWWRLREPGWQTSIVFNTIGAIACFTVLAIVAVTKFLDGAWLAVILVPALILMMKAIHHHYTVSEVELTPETPTEPDQIKHTIIVPVSKLNQVALQTLAYARSIARDGDDSVTAVHVSDDVEETAELQREWQEWHCDVPLVIIESPYRSLSGPLLAYIDAIHAKRADDTLTVVMPEFVPQRWWEHLLHNQTALRLKAALLFRPGLVVTSVPYHLRRSESAVPAGHRGTRTHRQPGAAVEGELEHVSSLDGEQVGTSGRRRKVVRHH